MKFFYKITVDTSKENSITFFIVADETEDTGQIPELKPELLKKNKTYIDFAKKINVDVYPVYLVYKSESDLSPPSGVPLFEHLQNLIDNGEASYIASSELTVTPLKSKNSAKKKKKKTSKSTIIIFIAITAVVGLFGFGFGMKYSGSLGSDSSSEPLSNQNIGGDGLIIPKQGDFSSNAELLTISIDRSYSPVPREDLQLKGEIVNGAAAIKLPEFNRTDFFSHVYGYTWGFTSDPNGTKIEYYGGMTYEFTQNVKLYRVLVKYGGGSGTKDDPYLINWFDQLGLMSQEKASGYFRQIDNIVFPPTYVHIPINTINELKRSPDLERFEYDGGGFTVSGLTSPLFGEVSGCVIKNVNITNSFINTLEYKNLAFIACEAYNYRYDADGATYETGETLIQNCTVSHSAIRLEYPTVDENGNPLPETVPPATEPLPPDVVLPDDGYVPQPQKNAEYAIGGITGLGGQIENCYINDVGIYPKINEYFLYAGGVSGKPANVKNCGVVYLSIEGNVFNAGGIAGSAGGSRLYTADGKELPVFYGGNIQGCFVRLFNGYSEVAAGGIAGESSTNSENPLISNCYAATIDLRAGVFEDDNRIIAVKSGMNGGIIGTDGNEDNGHLVVNTVSLEGYPVIGSTTVSSFDETVRLAPAYAFYQESILDVINRNTVHPNNPAVIFSGSFTFGNDYRNSDEGGVYAFPEEIWGLFEKTYVNEGGLS